MKFVPAGCRLSEKFVPDASHTAAAMGNPGVDVVATTALILFFEETAHRLLLPYFESGEITVGTRVDVNHTAPARVGIPIYVQAVLKQQQGREFIFDLQAKQGDSTVMKGVHHRKLVRQARYANPHSETPGMNQKIQFWFDFHSPWCYFASSRIVKLASRFGLDVEWKPVHLAQLNEAVSGRKPLEENRRFVDWYLQDQKDHAQLYELPFEPHQDYPLRPSRALRGALYAAEQGLAGAYVGRVMRAYWSEQRDISDLDTLRELANDVGLDGDSLCIATSDHGYKEGLNGNLEQAVSVGLFGLPSTVLNNKIYFGNDRLELLANHLTGHQDGQGN